MSFNSGERIAAASVISGLAGLLLPKAAFHSLDRALLVWLVFSVLAGLIVSAIPTTLWKTALKRTLLPSILVPFTFLGFLFVRWVANWIKDPSGSQVTIPVFSGVSVDPLSGLTLTGLSVLFIVGSVATFLVVALAALGSRPIIYSLVKANDIGPEGVERLNKIVLGVGGLLAALAALWVAFGE